MKNTLAMRTKSVVASRNAPFREVNFSLLATKPSARSVINEKKNSVRKRVELPVPTSDGLAKFWAF
jgi:hypothetical protein